MLRKVARPPVLSAVGGSELFGRQRRPMLYLPTYLAPFINCLRSSSFPVPTTFAKVTGRCQIRKTT